jgi:hypothetical protein
MKRFLQILRATAKVLLVTAVVVWLADWGMFRVRAGQGTAFDSVQVEQYLTTALKGNKQEYDYMGPAQVTCARALFPHGGAPACWWVRRHRTEWE